MIGDLLGDLLFGLFSPQVIIVGFIAGAIAWRPRYALIAGAGAGLLNWLLRVFVLAPPGLAVNVTLTSILAILIASVLWAAVGHYVGRWARRSLAGDDAPSG